MLEDNLDNVSYKATRAVVERLVGDKAIIVRNPCPECFAGNEIDALGDPREFHELKNFSALKAKDIYTLDGVGYRYPNEVDITGIDFNTAKELLATSISKNLSIFGLWRFDRQGLKNASQLQHPDLREYFIPTEEQARYDIELLRHGLN